MYPPFFDPPPLFCKFVFSLETRLLQHRCCKVREVEKFGWKLSSENVEDSLIGGHFKRGISGGEKRRVSIGMQLLTDPSIIFLDEPTSGLDGFNAKNVMQTLLDLARCQRTVLCTIHQPRSDIFHLFDQVMFLSAGQVVYFGPAQRLDQYLSSVGYPLPSFTNPADFAIDLMTVDRRSPASREMTEKRLESLVKSFHESSLFHDVLLDEEEENSLLEASAASVQAVRREERAPSPPMEHSPPPSMPIRQYFREQAHHHRASLWRQIWLLVSRYYVITFRDPKMFWTTILMVVGTSLMMGTIMFDMSTDQVGIQDRFAAVYLLSTMATYNMMMLAIVNYETERFVFAREKEDHLYTSAAFFWSKTIAEFPLEILQQLLFVSILYFMEGLVPAVDRFFLTAGVMMSAVYAMNSLGILVATLVPRISTNTVTANTIFTLFLFSAGWAFNLDTIPAWISWIKPVSPLKYTLEAYVKIQFEGQTFSCPGSQGLQPGGVCPIPDGNAAMHFFSMDNASLATSFTFLWCFAVLMRTGVFWALRWVPQRPT